MMHPENIPNGKSPVRRQIDAMEGDEFRIAAVSTRDVSLFAQCITHDITIKKPGFGKALVIHAQGDAPVVGAAVKRKRVSAGYALIWSDADGKVTGGGFTTAAVPRDWRTSPKPVEAA